MNELVTAVITTYKREPEILRRAVESVVNQSWRPLELYVINDCPEDVALSDRIRAMILDVQQSHSDLSIQYVPLEHNSGACIARNKGLELAKGEFISFLDDDDTWEPEKISEQIGGFTSKKVGMVYSPFYNVDFKGKKELIVRGDKSGILLNDLLYRNVIGGTSMPMMRTSAMRDIGGFDPDMLSSQDYDTWVRMAEKYEIQFVGKPLTVRYLTGESITTNLKKKESGWLRFTEKYLHYYKDNREAFSNRLSLMVGEMIALNNREFVNSVLERYKGLYNQGVKLACYKATAKTIVKRVLRKKIMEENVLIALSSLAINNGVASCIMNYYKSVIEKGYHVDFLVLKRVNSEREVAVVNLGSKIYVLPESEKLISKSKNEFLKNLIRENGYSIVHVNIPYHNGRAVLKAAKSSGVPVRIYHVHCPKREDSFKTKLKSDVYTPCCVNNATDYLSCSHLAASTLFGKKEYHILHNAIEAKKFEFDEDKRNKLRNTYGLDNAFVVGAVCRIDKLKNPFFLIDTFGEIKKRESSAKLVWLGSGDLDEQVKQYTKEKGLIGDCIFLGSRTDVNDWYSAMDVLLFPSTLEGLGMVLIEAQASGLMCYTSKNVSKETDLTGLVHFVDLGEGAPKWAETILKQAKDYRRVSRIKEVTEAGYNIDSLKDDLGSIYGQCVMLRHKEKNL